MTTTAPTDRLQDRPVSQFMTARPVRVGADTSVAHALATMHGHGLEYVLVVDQAGWCLGAVDAVALMTAEHRGGGMPVPVSAAIGVRVTPRVLVDSTLQHAADVMTRCGVGALPVVDDDGELAGLLSARDVVAALAG
jgi:acetoin utilization protein AcuB